MWKCWDSQTQAQYSVVLSTCIHTNHVRNACIHFCSTWKIIRHFSVIHFGSTTIIINTYFVRKKSSRPSVVQCTRPTSYNVWCVCPLVPPSRFLIHSSCYISCARHSSRNSSHSALARRDTGMVWIRKLLLIHERAESKNEKAKFAWMRSKGKSF